jgi:hypothetical protein
MIDDDDPDRLANLSCPFCNAQEFDRIGLKLHLTLGSCDEFDRINIRGAAVGFPLFGSGRGSGGAG